MCQRSRIISVTVGSSGGLCLSVCFVRILKYIRRDSIGNSNSFDALLELESYATENDLAQLIVNRSGMKLANRIKQNISSPSHSVPADSTLGNRHHVFVSHLG